MAYDPNLPAAHSPQSSAEMREQFGGLKDEIDMKVDHDYVVGLLESQTAGNVNGVELAEFTISNPPTQAQVQALADKVYELHAALRRMTP